MGMIVYKIRRSDGLFSKGGMSPSFSKKGKVWTSKGAVSNHISLVGGYKRKAYGEDIVVVVYNMGAEGEVVIPITEWTAGMDERREKREGPRVPRNPVGHYGVMNLKSINCLGPGPGASVKVVKIVDDERYKVEWRVNRNDPIYSIVLKEHVDLESKI